MNHSIQSDERTERLLASASLYAEDASVDIDMMAGRLTELAEGDETALGRAHRRAVLRAGEHSADAVTRRTLEITRRALERTGSC